MFDNGDEVLDGETNKELTTVASFLATRGVISDVISTLSVIGTIKYYTFPSVQMLHECTFLFKNVNCILCDCMCLCKSYTYVHVFTCKWRIPFGTTDSYSSCSDQLR